MFQFTDQKNITSSIERQIFQKIKEQAISSKQLKFIKKNSPFEDHHQQHEYREDEDEIRDTQ